MFLRLVEHRAVRFHADAIHAHVRAAAFGSRADVLDGIGPRALMTSALAILAGHFQAVRLHVHADDALRPAQPRAFHRHDAHRAAAEDGDGLAALDARPVDAAE